MSLQLINPKAEGTSLGQHALIFNINAAKGLQEVLRSNLGPKGTIKMLVGGAGDIKLTKDGSVLLHEMVRNFLIERKSLVCVARLSRSKYRLQQIQHPTAALVARAATAQDDITGDGTTTNVLLIGELLKQCERYLFDGVHPRILTEGFDLAKNRALEFLESFKQPKKIDRELLLSVARTSLRSKLTGDVADQLSEIVTDAILTIKRDNQPVDLFMVEVLTMQHRLATETKLVKGLVLDHGARHPDMRKRLENCFIMILNVSLEWEKPYVEGGV